MLGTIEYIHFPRYSYFSSLTVWREIVGYPDSEHVILGFKRYTSRGGPRTDTGSVQEKGSVRLPELLWLDHLLHASNDLGSKRPDIENINLRRLYPLVQQG